MLRDMRKKLGISQAKLAEQTGIAQGVISYIECGRTRHPRIDTLQALASALGCTVDDLIETGGQADGKTT